MQVIPEIPPSSSLPPSNSNRPSIPRPTSTHSIPTNSDSVPGSSSDSAADKSIPVPASPDQDHFQANPSAYPSDRVSYVFTKSKTDRISQVTAASRPEPELALPCTVTFNGSSFLSISATAVVDTAAGFSYISLSESLRAKISTRSIPPFRVGLADDSSAIIRHRANVQISIPSEEGKPAITDSLDVFLFSSPNPDHECFLLLGRSSLRKFQIYTGPGLVYLRNGAVLLNHNRAHESVRSVSTPASPDVERIIDWLCNKGWEHLIRASNDYEFRLRPLLAGELKDTPEQTHAFDIRIPQPSQSSRSMDPDILSKYIREVESAARGHLSRQSSRNKEKAGELIREYVDLQFWIPSTESECRKVSAHLPTPVFLIGGDGDSSGRKPRLVCNFRPANKLLPPAGNSDRVPSHLLAALRLSNPRVILVTDASRAFYKLRLCDPEKAGADKLWLIAASPLGGVQHFLCSRLAFGLAVGPSALVSTISALMGFPRAFRSFIGWYIDDLIVASHDAVSVFNDFSLIESLLKRVGHYPQREKTYLISHSSTRAETGALFGSELPLQESAKVFGAHLSFDSECLSIQCDNADKVVALSVLSSLSLENSTLTKKDFFKLGGQLGYDLPQQHAEISLFADCLRSIIGRVQVPWHQPLKLSSLLPENLQSAMIFLREWAINLSKFSPQCSHFSPLDPSMSVPIEVFCDASLSGGAFIITRAGRQIWQEACRWSGTKVRWHSNRLECYTLWSAIRCLADIL